MAVLHVFLVNSTLIYILFSLTITCSMFMPHINPISTNVGISFYAELLIRLWDISCLILTKGWQNHIFFFAYKNFEIFLHNSSFENLKKIFTYSLNFQEGGGISANISPLPKDGENDCIKNA